MTRLIAHTELHSTITMRAEHIGSWDNDFHKTQICYFFFHLKRGIAIMIDHVYTKPWKRLASTRMSLARAVQATSISSRIFCRTSRSIFLIRTAYKPEMGL